MNPVVLDPGHPNKPDSKPGYEGHGAVVELDDRTIHEKDVALEITKMIESLCIHSPSTTYETTRHTDRGVSLPARVQHEKRVGAECFISIHLNWFSDPDARGTEVFYYPGSNEGERLARSISNCFDYTEVPNRRTKVTDDRRDDDLEPYIYVLANTKSPAVLVETAFLSNPQDREWILSHHGVFQASHAIYRGYKTWSNGGEIRNA